MEEPVAPAPEKTRIWTRDYTLAWLCRFFSFFSLHMLIPTLPLHLSEMGSRPDGVGLVIAIFTFVATMFRPVVGYQVDARGPKVVLTVALVLYILGPLGYALAWAIPVLALWRVVHGMGWSGCTAGAGAVVANRAPDARRGEALATYTVASNVAAAIAAVVGVWVYFAFGAQILFVSAAFFGLLALASVQLLSPDARMPAREGHKATVKEYATSFFDRKSLVHLLPMFTATFAHGGINSFLPLQAVSSGLPNPGIYFTIFAASMALTRPVMGRLSDRYSRAAMAVPGFVLTIGALIMLAWLPSPQLFYIAAVVHGIGYGAIIAALIAGLVDSVPSNRRGTAMAQWSLFYDLGIGGGSALLGYVIRGAGGNYGWMYAVSCAVMLLGLGYYLKMRKRYQHVAV